MKYKTRFSTERMIELHKAGKSYAEISKELGCHKQTIHSHLKEVGLTKLCIHLSDDEKRIIAENPDKMTDKEIAEYIGCSPFTVMRYRKEAGREAQRVWTDEVYAKLRELHEMGLKTKYIAEKISEITRRHMSVMNIYSHIKLMKQKYGI